MTGLITIKPELRSDSKIVFSMQAAWHGNISRALTNYYEIVNLAAPSKRKQARFPRSFQIIKLIWRS
jgi:hypothetical protein